MRMNKTQKKVIAITINLILFVIALALSSSVTTGQRPPDDYASPFDFGYTWYVWLLFIIIAGIFNYKYFGNRNKD